MPSPLPWYTWICKLPLRILYNHIVLLFCKALSYSLIADKGKASMDEQRVTTLSDTMTNPREFPSKTLKIRPSTIKINTSEHGRCWWWRFFSIFNNFNIYLVQERNRCFLTYVRQGTGQWDSLERLMGTGLGSHWPVSCPHGHLLSWLPRLPKMGSQGMAVDAWAVLWQGCHFDWSVAHYF